jgi:hypothetical protein
MSSSFDILKKIGVLNFEWVEVVRDLQAAETRIQELQVRSSGEYTSSLASTPCRLLAGSTL